MKTLLVSLAFAVTSVRGAEVALNSPQLDRRGNDSTTAAFLILGNSSQRYQQVYAASDFARLPEGGGLITGIAFQRNNFQDRFFGAFTPNIQINFSTTPKNPDALSTTFALNVGLDDLVVFDRGGLTLGEAIAVEYFPIRIQFNHSFFYDPARGNLLMDVRNYSGYLGQPNLPGELDAERTLGDSVSVVGSALDVNALVGGSSTMGIVTRFMITPIPEPGSLSLALLGIFGLGVFWWSRTKRRGSVGSESRAWQEKGVMHEGVERNHDQRVAARAGSHSSEIVPSLPRVKCLVDRHSHT